jgi:hypothetical protein
MTIPFYSTCFAFAALIVSRGNGTYLSQPGGEDGGKYLKRNGGG